MGFSDLFALNENTCYIPLLHAAAFYGDFIKAESLLKQGSDANEVDNLGYRPIHWASISGKVNIVSLLLDNDAEVDIKGELSTQINPNTKTYSSPSLVEILQSKFTSIDLVKVVNQVCKNGGPPFLNNYTPLQLATVFNRVQTMKKLIEYNADIYVTDNLIKNYFQEIENADTLLSLARFYKCKQAEFFLLEIGVKDLHEDYIDYNIVNSYSIG